MERLYVLRHGIAQPHGAPGVADDDRELTPKGEDRMRAAARGLGGLDLKLDRIVTSPLPRARRTAEIVAEALGVVLETADALRAGNPADAIREWLRGRTEKRLMIVGHEPSLSDLLGLMLGVNGPSPFELKKGGVVALCREDVGPYRLQWAMTPAILRALKG